MYNIIPLLPFVLSVIAFIVMIVKKFKAGYIILFSVIQAGLIAFMAWAINLPGMFAGLGELIVGWIINAIFSIIWLTISVKNKKWRIQLAADIEYLKRNIEKSPNLKPIKD